MNGNGLEKPTPTTRSVLLCIPSFDGDSWEAFTRDTETFRAVHFGFSITNRMRSLQMLV